MMLLALLLDWLGQVLIFVFILAMSDWTGVELSGDTLQVQGPWLVFVLLLYPLLGWLFGALRTAGGDSHCGAAAFVDH